MLGARPSCCATPLPSSVCALLFCQTPRVALCRMEVVGRPSESNVLVFNGDFVDRGAWCVHPPHAAKRAGKRLCRPVSVGSPHRAMLCCAAWQSSECTAGFPGVWLEVASPNCRSAASHAPNNCCKCCAKPRAANLDCSPRAGQQLLLQRACRPSMSASHPGCSISCRRQWGPQPAAVLPAAPSIHACTDGRVNLSRPPVLLCSPPPSAAGVWRR